MKYLRYPLFILVLCITCHAVNAQLQKDTIYILTSSAEIDLANNTLTDFTLINQTEENRIRDMHLDIEYGELIIDYVLDDRLTKIQRNQSYDIRIEISVGANKLNLPSYYTFGDVGYGVTTNEGKKKRIVVSNLMDEYMNLSGTIIVNLFANHRFSLILRRPLDCDNPPTFTKKDKLPHLISAAGGVALLGAGFAIKSKSDKKYKEYKAQSDGVTAEFIYDDANGKYKTSQIMKVIGASMLVTDAALYYLRNRIYKQTLEDYRKHCDQKPAIGFKPMYETPTATLPNGSLGLSMTYTFGR